ncbi:uncharacterized protein V6R79_023726 [Siganus canaliculatus]
MRWDTVARAVLWLLPPDKRHISKSSVVACLSGVVISCIQTSSREEQPVCTSKINKCPYINSTLQTYEAKQTSRVTKQHTSIAAVTVKLQKRQ